MVYLLTRQESDLAQEIAAQLVAIASEPRLNNLHAIKSAHLAIAKEQSNMALYADDRWATEATERLLPFANARPNHVYYSVYSEALWKGLESAWTGVQSPADAVAHVEATLKAQISDEVIIR